MKIKLASRRIVKRILIEFNKKQLVSMTN